MHSIQGTTTDLSEFVWVYYNDWYSPGSCRKDFAEYGIGAQNVAVNSQSGGYVLKLDKDCFQEDFINGADYLFAFYMNPAPDYETIGPLAADQPWIYLKITDGTNTTYFPLKFKIYDDPDG